MFVNWDEVQRALSPIKDYEDLSRRLQISFAYPFVRETFNFSIAALVEYTRLSVGGDPRGRYNDYAERLIGILSELQQAKVSDLLELVSRTQTREQLKGFAEKNRIYAHDIVGVLKYLIYWFIPGEKYLSGLIRPDPALSAAIKALGGMGIRTNLDLLQQGLTPERRQALAQASEVSQPIVDELVNRADLSRMPWASKATISNIIGAGYGSLAQLANADPEQLYADFFAYGASIGKNLKLGNEIENSYRIARIVPALVKVV